MARRIIEMSALHVFNARRFKGFDFTAQLSRCAVKEEHGVLSEKLLSAQDSNNSVWETPSFDDGLWKVFMCGGIRSSSFVAEQIDNADSTLRFFQAAPHPDQIERPKRERRHSAWVLRLFITKACGRFCFRSRSGRFRVRASVCACVRGGPGRAARANNNNLEITIV